MNKVNLEKWDLPLTYTKLESGLEVYVIEKEDSNKTYVSITSRFGGKDIEFIPVGEKKYYTVPKGIAHFLEHQLFNMEDGSDPLEQFYSTGCYSNAETTEKYTRYYFSGVENIEENIDYLLRFVSSPYFTDDSVKKEKGIIIEELKMYQNYPSTELYEKMNFNTFLVRTERYPVIGTVKDIKKITKEDLYKCYNTFYHPSNMYVVISGNVDSEEVIEQIRNHSINQNFIKDKQKSIKRKKYIEPNQVKKEYEEIIKTDIMPKIGVVYKVAFGEFTDEEKKKILIYTKHIINSNFSVGSDFYEEMRDKGLLVDSLGFTVGDYDDHMIVWLYGDVLNSELVIKEVTKRMESLSIDEETLERKKKVSLGSYVLTSENVTLIAHFIEDLIDNNVDEFSNRYSFYKNLNLEEMAKYFKNLKFKNKSVIVIKEKE